MALIVAVSQATPPFAPELFGALLAASAGEDLHVGQHTDAFFGALAGTQGLAILALLAGWRRR